MNGLRCDVEPVGTRLLVRVRGDLALPTAPKLRATLMKCLVEQPDAVVVDLRAACVSGSTAASVLAAVARQAAFWPDVPLLIVASALPRSLGHLPLFGSVEQAMAVEARRQTFALGDVLLPTSGAARRARDLATEACARWDLPGLTGPAGVVVSELVANAVEHAQTMADLRITLGRRRLMIAVRDGSPVEPRLTRATSLDPAAPRGLMLVESLSQRWSFVPIDGGKVVWAALACARQE